jgi:protein-disulfide isomerase
MWQSPAAALPVKLPAGASAEGDGIVLGTGSVTVDIYVDFQCPFCRRFESVAGPTLDSLLESGTGRLVYHPLGFLDRISPTHYSSRAAAASACAADGGMFKEYKDVLFANQPAEGGPGLSDEQLTELGLGLGLDASFVNCVAVGAHLDWVPYVSVRAIERGVEGTPSVFVAGAPVEAEPQAILAAVSSPHARASSERPEP